jgi:hypothetical protein
MNNRSAYRTDDDKIKELKFKLLYLKRDDFIYDNGDEINENTRKTYDNILYNCEDNDNDEDDNENSNVYGFNKIQNIKETNYNSSNNSFLSSLPSSYHMINYIDFKLSENDNLENYIYYSDLIKDNNSNLIDGLK